MNIIHVGIRKNLLLNPPVVRSLVTLEGTVFRLLRTGWLRPREVVCGRFRDYENSS